MLLWGSDDRVLGADQRADYHRLLPAATVGHFIGLRFHRYTLRADTRVFFRYLGVALLVVSGAGILRMALSG